MGRTVIDFPLEEIASFIADPDSAPLYDKYITVSHPSSLCRVITFIIQESRTVHRISYSETHTDAIGKSRLTATQTDTEFSFFAAYFKSEAKHCLVKAVRDFLFYVRYLHFVSKW